MYDYIQGTVTELSPAYAVLDNAGIGYFIRISMFTFEKLQNQNRAKLYVELVIREDGHFLFGFYDKTERELFRLLTSVSGIGSSSAMLLLSAFDSNRLRDAIINEDVAQLKSVKGIGPKTAKRLIVELKDKLLKDYGEMPGTVRPVSSPAYDEALVALEVLGYPRKTTAKIVRKILEENPSAPTEQIIKTALKRL